MSNWHSNRKNIQQKLKEKIFDKYNGKCLRCYKKASGLVGWVLFDYVDKYIAKISLSYDEVIQFANRNVKRYNIYFSTGNLIKHHFIPVSEGGKTDEFNLTLLCHNCHIKEHKHMREENKGLKSGIQVIYIPDDFDYNFNYEKLDFGFVNMMENWWAGCIFWNKFNPAKEKPGSIYPEVFTMPTPFKNLYRFNITDQKTVEYFLNQVTKKTIQLKESCRETRLESIGEGAGQFCAAAPN